MTETPPPAKKAPAGKAAPSPKAPPAKKPAAAKAASASKTPAASKPAAKKPAPTKAAPAAGAATASAATPAPSAATAPPPPPPPPAPAAPVAPYVAPGPGAHGPGAPVAPQPMLESDARMWAMLLHILAAVALVLSAGTIAFVVPLVIWLIYRERSALVDHHGKNNLNLQLTSLVVIIAGTIIGFVTLFIGFFVTVPLMIAYGLYALIISIVAGVKANNGEYYNIPVVIPFIR